MDSPQGGNCTYKQHSVSKTRTKNNAAAIRIGIAYFYIKYRILYKTLNTQLFSQFTKHSIQSKLTKAHSPALRQAARTLVVRLLRA